MLAIVRPTINVRQRVKPAINAEAGTISAAGVKPKNGLAVSTNRLTTAQKRISKKKALIRTTAKRQIRNRRLKSEKPSNWSIHSSEDEYIFCIGNDSGNEITLKIGGVQLTVVLDSGSKFNVIDNKTWEFLKTNKIEVFNQSKIVNQSFKAYGGHPLTTIGSFDAKIETKQNCLIANFIVVKDYGKALIGYNTGIPLGVIKIGECVNQVEQNGQMSKIKGFVVDIPINDDVKPVAQPYRRVPVALEETVDKKIEELLSLGIIEKVNEPSKWISPVVPVPKYDDVRICIDMRRANEAVERENHPLPTMEDFLPHIGKGHFFAKLDVKNAFHQV